MKVEDTDTAFVLDTSFTLAWILEEEGQEERVENAFALLDDLAAAVPSLWFYEVSNALFVNERRGRLSLPETTRAIALLKTLPINIDSECESRTRSEILTLARTHNLTVYDATYLDMSMRMSLPLATLDKELIQASQSLGVELL